MTQRHPFPDLPTPGRSLVAALEGYRRAEGAIVLGIVRGGVPAALEVAMALALPLDLIVSRGLFQHPSGEIVRAARIAGTLVLDDAGREVNEIFVAEALASLQRRDAECRGTRPAVMIEGKVVLVVDNGMRTGRTMAGAVRLIRKLGPSRVVAAVPVATTGALGLVERLTDELVCLLRVEQMGHVGLFYDRFDVPNERQVHELLEVRERG